MEKAKDKDKEKDRVGFDRGAVPPLAVAISAVLATQSLAQLPTNGSLGPEDGEQEPGVETEVLTREVIKASSRTKLAQRKRGSGNAGAAAIDHLDHDG